MYKQFAFWLSMGFAQLSMAQTDYGVSEGNEELLIQSLNAISEQNFDDALSQLKNLTEIRPDFRLAQLVYADMLSAQASALASVGNTGQYDSPRVKGLIEEARARFNVTKDKPSLDMIPKDLVLLSKEQKYVIVQDMSLSRLYLFENRNGVPHLIKDYYASHGRGGVGKQKQGDLRSPVGVYFTTGRLLDRNLPQRYGAGALPLNYPNSWDYRLKRTGNGIWVHGTPVDTYSRPPRASEGCLSLSNPDFQELDALVDSKNTPVILGTELEWISKQQWMAQQQQAVAMVERWASDWESLDFDRYIDHYSNEFSDGSKNYRQFAEHKRRVNGAKQFIDIDLNKLSIFSYPNNPGLMVVSFEQDYKSNNYQSRGIKRQYWQRQGDRWRIAYEGLPSKGIP